MLSPCPGLRCFYWLSRQVTSLLTLRRTAAGLLGGFVVGTQRCICSLTQISHIWGCGPPLLAAVAGTWVKFGGGVLFWGVVGPAAGAGVPSRTAGTPWGRGLIQAWHVDVESAGCSLSAATRSISTSHGWLVPSASDSWLMVVAFGRGARLPRGGACFVGCVRPARASCSRGVCGCGVGCSGQAGVLWLPPMACDTPGMTRQGKLGALPRRVLAGLQLVGCVLNSFPTVETVTQSMRRLYELQGPCHVTHVFAGA